MRAGRLDPQFVEFIPERVQEGTLYVSMTYATAVHRCACGCGHEVVTPLSPSDWKLFFDGESISLSPSIGNWSFACRSHYWIERNAVRWVAGVSSGAIGEGCSRDRCAKTAYHHASAMTSGVGHDPAAPACQVFRRAGRRMWAALSRWWPR